MKSTAWKAKPTTSTPLPRAVPPTPIQRKLLGDLAAAESKHQDLAGRSFDTHLGAEARQAEDMAAHRQFVLTWVQPGLAGLMDGSVSTLAPIFATAFATQNTWTTFLVGLSASVGAGISMGFTEAAHDDGKIPAVARL